MNTNKTITIAGILIAVLLVQGASAITIDSYEMQIAENGDSTIKFTYTLSTLERIAVFMKLADPAAELKNVIDQNTDREVEVLDVESGYSSFLVPGFIPPKTDSGGLTYTTPATDFSKGEEILRGYWFAPMITIDLSPETTKITFPDGYCESFADTHLVPSVSHTV